MTGVELISIGLSNESCLAIEQINTICSFTGKHIDRGVKLKNVISSNFTDLSFIRYNSGYCCIEIAKCMAPMSKESKASLRNYSFFATKSGIALLNKDNMQEVLLSEKQTPFVFAVSYNGKKHISYKTISQYDSDNFTVFTDIGEVYLRKTELLEIIPIIKRWYSVIKGKEESTTQPTNFTKDEILSGIVQDHKVEKYGVVKFFEENAILEKYRAGTLLNLLVHILKKTIHGKD